MYLVDRVLKYGVISKLGIDFDKDSQLRLSRNVAKSFSVNIQNVVDYLYASPQEHFDHFEDFPNVAPPFPFMFLEYKTPDFSNMEGKIIRNENAGLTMGVLVNSSEINEERELPPFIPIDKFYGSKWLQEITFFTYDETLGKTHPAIVFYILYMAVSADGKRQPLGLTNGGEKNPYIAPLFKFDERMFEMNKVMGSLIIEMSLAISFMHCKNIPVTINRDSIIKFKNKNIQREDLMKIYTLDIHPIKTLFKKESNNENFSKRALHICRGHFKDFRDGQGLFGKHKGLYFWDMMTRGTISSGVVVKDYKIIP